VHRCSRWAVQSYLPGLYLANMIKLVLPSAHTSPQPNSKMGKSIGSAVFAQLTAGSPYTLQGGPFAKNCPFPSGIWTPI